MKKLFINQDFATGQTAFHLVDDRDFGMGKKRQYAIGKKGCIIERDLEETGPSEPIMVLPAALADAFIRGCMEYGQKKGMNVEREDWMRGAMKMMKAHLDREMLIVDRLMEKKGGRS